MHVASHGSTPFPSNLAHSIWNTVALIILCNILDAKNVEVFRGIGQTRPMTITNIISDFTLWSHRFKQADIRVDADLWRNHISHCNL
jgi:hypothetical protein